MSATGLVEAEVRKLSEAQKRDLVAWSLSKCGGDELQPFLPNAVRWLPLEQRLVLAEDVGYDAAWEEAERRKVAEGGLHPVTGLWVPGHAYFTEAYGHLKPPKGSRIPFDLWPAQRDVLEQIREWSRQVWLKARQLGMTWLALHDGFHLLAFDPENPIARILALSKHGGDATKLISRARNIQECLPPFLRPTEARDTQRSNTRFGITGRGEMVSLAGTPSAARQETAALAILDEFGFIKNRQAGETWTAVQPTLGEDGRAIVLSTGNGPEEVKGDGQAFAQLVGRAMASEQIRFVFLPSSTDPRRTAEWRERERDNYLSDEEFEAEYAETVEQALQGRPGAKVYPPAGVNAAERIGRVLDELREDGKLPPPAPPGRAEIPAIDFGEQTHGLALHPLERGGFFCFAEVVHAHLEPEQLVEPLLGAAEALGRVGAAHFDAAGVQSMRTFLATARRARWPKLESLSVPFGEYKNEAVLYSRRLFRRSAAFVEACDRAKVPLAEALTEGLPTPWNEEKWGKRPPTTAIMAVSPSCSVLLRQLRGLEFKDDDSGKVEKGDDHGPDALLAGVAPTARRFRATRDEHDESGGDDSRDS
jgi:hypothetical protein